MGIIGINKPTETNTKSLDMMVINNIKALGIDMINSAKSGHPGIVLGAAPIIYRLYQKHLVFDSKNPNYINRDRFVMSAGHGSALLYATLFMSGFDITVDDLKEFRKYGSKTPGHPEITTPGVDCSTGPLGQGLATAVGMAIGETYLNERYKYQKTSLIDHYTYVLCGDGDLMEGISYEAAAVAGNLGLGKLIVLYDSNSVTLDGSTKYTLTENVLDRFKALGWDTHSLNDAYDLEEFDNLISKAKENTDKPSIIEIRTTIGKDSKFENSNVVHGKPLEEEDIKQIKNKLKIRDVEYTVLSEAFDYMNESISSRCEPLIKEFEEKRNAFLENINEEEKEKYLKFEEDNIDYDLDKIIFKFSTKTSYSGRDISRIILNNLNNEDILCLTTDTSSSTKVYFANKNVYSKKDRLGQNITCGVRELATSAILNGILLMNIRAVTSTFLSFSNYMMPSIRMAALMNLKTVYVFTHDSVLIGEDGPTHMPIEQLDALRLVPNLTVIRPCDRNEMIGAYKIAFKNSGPTVIIASKDILPLCDNTDINKVENGAYSLRESENDNLIILSSGSEVNLALKLSRNLERSMIKSRVVSVPSLNLLDKKDEEYIKKLLPIDIPKVVIELSTCSCYYKYLNRNDQVFNITNFEKSGNKEDIKENINYTEEKLKDLILENLNKESRSV